MADDGVDGTAASTECVRSDVREPCHGEAVARAREVDMREVSTAHGEARCARKVAFGYCSVKTTV